MMPDLYDIVHILEGHNSATLRFAFSRWQRGKEVLENLHNSLTNWRGEALQDIALITVCVQKNKQKNKSVIQYVMFLVSQLRLESSCGLSGG